MSDLARLPIGWAVAPLGTVLPIEYGASLPKTKRAEGEHPVFGSNGIVGHHEAALTSGPAIVVGRKGSAGAVHFSGVACWPIDTTYYCEHSPVFDLRFAAHLLTHLRLDQWDRSTAVPSLSRDDYNAVHAPVPPLPEQLRIIAKIDELFSDLDAGVAALERVQAKLKRYRASVLNAAVAGKLTEAWRQQNPPAEPAEKLLARILGQRQQEWSRKGPYKPPVAMDSEVPQLPTDWRWATLDQLGQAGRPIIYGIIKPGPHIPDGVPYVRVTEMKDGQVDVPNLRRTSRERAAKFARATLAADDILISKDGTIGRVAVVPPELAGGNITQHVMRAPVNGELNLRYLVWAIRSDRCQHWLTGETRGVALRGVNVEDFRRLPIPVPPLCEQGQIAAEVERRLSVVEAVEAEVEQGLKRAARLRQAILKRAFEGKLVPQDPADEPASALLDRLRQSNVAATPTKRSSRQRSTASATQIDGPR